MGIIGLVFSFFFVLKSYKYLLWVSKYFGNLKVYNKNLGVGVHVIFLFYYITDPAGFQFRFRGNEGPPRYSVLYFDGERSIWEEIGGTHSSVFVYVVM